jgi:hypothetical protein
MPTPTVLEIMTGVEGLLKTLPGRVQVNDHAPSDITPPAFILTVPPIDYRVVFGARRWRLDLTITLLTSANLDRPGQRLLAEYAAPTGPKSVFQLFAGGGDGVTLGGLVEQAYVTDFEPLGLERVAQIGYFGGEWPLHVYASGG